MTVLASSSAWLWDDASVAWRWGSVAAWALVLAVMAPVMWRLATRRPRYTDPLLGVVTLLTLNRESFLLRINATGSHATAFALALLMAWMAWSYQRADSEAES